MDSQADEATGLEQSQQWLNFTHIVVYSYLILLLCLGVSGLAALAHELVLWTQERVRPPVLVPLLVHDGTLLILSPNMYENPTLSPGMAFKSAASFVCRLMCRSRRRPAE